MNREILRFLASYSKLTPYLSNGKLFSTSTRLLLDKQLIKSLRKRTGYPFAKCNEALKLHDDNAEKAEEWLHEQAQKEGWSKAEKLKDRSTSQGLVGVLAQNNFVSLVEVACETDFVARNELFRDLVSSTAAAVLQFRKDVIDQNSKVSSNAEEDITHLREIVMEHELKNLKVPSKNMTLEQDAVSLVGKIGENIKLKRAMAIATSRSNIIGSSTHGNVTSVHNDCQMGSYAGVVVLKASRDSVDQSEAQKLARGLSQHVIGMNPLSLEPDGNVSEENSLLRQEYLLNDQIIVKDLLDNAGVEVVDFLRFSLSN